MLKHTSSLYVLQAYIKPVSSVMYAYNLEIFYRCTVCMCQFMGKEDVR